MKTPVMLAAELAAFQYFQTDTGRANYHTAVNQVPRMVEAVARSFDNGTAPSDAHAIASAVAANLLAGFDPDELSLFLAATLIYAARNRPPF